MGSRVSKDFTLNVKGGFFSTFRLRIFRRGEGWREQVLFINQ